MLKSGGGGGGGIGILYMRNSVIRGFLLKAFQFSKVVLRNNILAKQLE